MQQALNFSVLHDNCQKNSVLLKIPTRGEMAELSEPAGKNCGLQKASLLFLTLAMQKGKKKSVSVLKGAVFVVEDLLPPFLTPTFFKFTVFHDLP